MTNRLLYLHGLDSLLQDDRRAVLQTYGMVEGPTINYKNTPNLFQKLQQNYADIEAIIGSSAGGLVAYYLAQYLQKPCLLFNPALTFRAEMPIPTAFNKNYKEYMQIVVGGQDKIISAWESIEIIKEDISENQNINIHFTNTMQHSYDIDIFRKEVEFFFTQIR
ncbi:alpha/beta hydrolase [Capnocytophaga canis]|uniref:Alpha/beta hydrolase n=1 Tax=Capnocytophaga canis TaxID=1848903 RepID=A0A3A1YI90_9FLAO|nr:YqiA/YcfP family alpha/beta fold hydrolase [Capnocytophaga canis]RIY36979.1 alpha/beta hydrolase [Capnocytophaga canis]